MPPVITRPLGLVAAAALTLAWIPPASRAQGYQDLLALFSEFVAFERPPMRSGAPDYTDASILRRREMLKTFQTRLASIDGSTWPVDRQVDRALVEAMFSAMDFDLHVLRPWARDPAFYKSLWMGQSDTPAHEGPTHHAVVELWTYAFPLSPADEAKLAAELATIPSLLSQARLNLTGNARDLWMTGIGTMAQQVTDLEALETRVGTAGAPLRRAVREAIDATHAFVIFLKQEAGRRTGPSGVGRAAYTWHLQKAQLVPMTWEDEVALLKRELARAHASLKLEEERNRSLPPLVPAADADEYRRRADAAVTKYLAFLRDRNLLDVQPYLDAALRAHIGGFVPIERRNFFGIASHYEPMTLFAHFYHWWDHAWMKERPHPSPVRRGATLYNVWANRAEGMATAMEEIILHAGYYDDNPRAREIVWIMLAQRAARGLASLYTQANEMDIAAAKAFQVEWTPRGWMRPDLDLLHFEQQLYLRQPAYGTSYVSGKYLIDELIKDRARQLGDAFTLRRFFDEFNAAGVIPVSLIRWQMTGRQE